MNEQELETFAEACDALAAYAQIVADHHPLGAIAQDALEVLRNAETILAKYERAIPDSMATILRRARSEAPA